MVLPGEIPMPPRMADLKREIVQRYTTPENMTKAWNDLLEHLAKAAKNIKSESSDLVPVVDFADLDKLDPKVIEQLKRRGCVVIRNIVPDEEVKVWKDDLKEYVKNNVDCEGIPEGDKQFFMLYWTKSQVRARAHKNVLATIAWMNKLYKTKSGVPIEGVDLGTPLSYADRFRIRHPGKAWDLHPPHIDGGSIERWEEPAFRTCFEEILKGNWMAHDPYELEGRLNGKTSIYGRPNQSSVFRTFQGWLALSETAPHEGTLKVFPDVTLSNTYLILRPFFRQKEKLVTEDPLDAQNWEFDDSTPDFPGIFARKVGFHGPRLTNASHPHMRLDETMTSVPKVYPGDMVFWHCDVVHSVEVEHTGKGDSAVMYIPAVPLTPGNEAYILRQKDSFLKGIPPPDFPVGNGISENTFIGTGSTADIVDAAARRAMGLPLE
ncbi:DUF1479-domain-containing protein [Rickenella mellea]|uniref:DUF1479-domain-containing protein n=1 Tax=Rickenella mellea TaxID=50990 RepID=A0A4Y7PRA9_9AGAM|nr:DUF1479-domain-containing protein [Rickenella mellea]